MSTPTGGKPLILRGLREIPSNAEEITRLLFADLRFCLPKSWGTLSPVDIPVTVELRRAIQAEIDLQALTHAKIYKKGGPSSPTMTKILEHDDPDPIAPSTAEKLERALGWEDGAIARLARAQAKRRGEVPAEPTQAELDAEQARRGAAG
jgi:hypothetical protein